MLICGAWSLGAGVFHGGFFFAYEFWWGLGRATAWLPLVVEESGPDFEYSERRVSVENVAEKARGQLNSEMRREKSEEFRPEVDPLSRGGVHGGIWSRKALDPGQRNLSNVARNCVSSTCVFLIRAASPFSFLPQSRSLPSNRYLK